MLHLRSGVQFLLAFLIFNFGEAAATKIDDNKVQIVNFVAGGIAGSIASTITTPLEVIKTQLQSSRLGGRNSPVEVFNEVLKKEGPLGFFKGIGPTLFGIIPARAIYFWSYTTSKSYLKPLIGDSSMNHLTSAFVAGISSNTITNPIWMVKTRYQIFADPSSGQRAYTSYIDLIRTIWKEEGPPGFFKGLSASYVGCLEGAIQWMVYEKAKASPFFQALPNNGNSNNKQQPPLRVPTSKYFLAAAASKFIAVCATYPHEVVRTRLREQASKGVFKYTGFTSALSTIAREEGIRGLYGGMGMHLLRSVPNAAIMFATFELTSRWMQDQVLAKSTASSSGSSSISSTASSSRTSVSPSPTIPTSPNSKKSFNFIPNKIVLNNPFKFSGKG